MRVGQPNSLYKYSSLQHNLNVCYKDCAKMHCAMFDMAFHAELYSRFISRWPSVNPCNADARPIRSLWCIRFCGSEIKWYRQ